MTFHTFHFSTVNYGPSIRGHRPSDLFDLWLIYESERQQLRITATEEPLLRTFAWTYSQKLKIGTLGQQIKHLLTFSTHIKSLNLIWLYFLTFWLLLLWEKFSGHRALFETTSCKIFWKVLRVSFSPDTWLLSAQRFDSFILKEKSCGWTVR